MYKYQQLINLYILVLDWTLGSEKIVICYSNFCYWIAIAYEYKESTGYF